MFSLHRQRRAPGTAGWVSSSLLLGGVVLVGLILLAWFVYNRDRQLAQQLVLLHQSLEELSHSAQETRQDSQEAQRLAREAKQAAELAAVGRARAEVDSQRAQRETRQVRQELEHAREATEQARAEAEQMRRQREAELNRLQEALSRIVETRRTALGLVMNLGNEFIQFDFDRAELRPENRELLARIAGVLLTSSGYRVQVYGHTDDVGSEDYNLRLSWRRAEAVRSYLVEAGIDPEIIRTKGMGKSNPVVMGATPEARQKNRRVEIGIVDTVISFKEAVPPESP